jgi:hypothetical protein
MLFPLLVLAIPTLFFEFIRIPTLQGQLNPESLSQWWYPLINDPYEIIYVENLLKVLLNAIDSVGIALSGLFIAYFLYGTIPFHWWNIRDIFEPLLGGNPFLHFIHNWSFFRGEGGNPFLHFIYNWSFFRGCIDGYYDIIFVGGIQILVKIKKNSQRMDNRWIYQWMTHPKLFDAFNCESKRIQIECRFLNFYIYSIMCNKKNVMHSIYLLLLLLL